MYFMLVLICGSLRDAWRTTGSKGSDSSECLFSDIYGFSRNEIRVDDSGWFF